MEISVPPPNAKPFTAAITTIGNCCSLLIISCPLLAKAFAFSESNVASSDMSAPATNDLSPAPVRIKTRISSSTAISSRAWDNSANSAPLRAFSALGRLKVMVAIPSLTSYMIFSYAMLSSVIVSVSCSIKQRGQFVKLKARGSMLSVALLSLFLARCRQVYGR